MDLGGSNPALSTPQSPGIRTLRRIVHNPPVCARFAPLSAFACGDAEFGSSGLPDSVVSPKLAESGSAHRRVDARDEPGVERTPLRGRKAFAQLCAILDSEDYGGHARDGERVAMGECGC